MEGGRPSTAAANKENHFILGIDIGTTSVKVCLVSAGPGRELVHKTAKASKQENVTGSGFQYSQRCVASEVWF